MKKRFWFVSLFLLLLFVPSSISANSPAPPSHFTVEISNRPEEAVYADLLLPMDASHEWYADFNEKATEDYGLDRNCQLAAYEEDGFVSYTFHFACASSEMDLRSNAENYSPGNIALFCYSYEDIFDVNQYGYVLKHFKQARIALADEEGNIIQVSDSFAFARDSLIKERSGYISYDAETNIAKDGTRSKYLLDYFVITFFIILFSCGVEILIALLFHFRGKELLVILLTNFITQLILHGVFLLFYRNYLLTLLIIELLVLVWEFTVYKLVWKERSTALLIGYTLVANFASFIAGVIFLLALLKL